MITLALFENLALEALIAARGLADYLSGGALRLGVTGLSRAGKTVFITSLVHNLTKGGRLPVFRVVAENRLAHAVLDPQPDDHVARFAYEDHLAALTGGAEGANARRWPNSTTDEAELRVTLEFERVEGWRSGPAKLHIDIFDYPGEWLLDLPLLTKSYAQWSRETLEASAIAARAPLAAQWRGVMTTLDPAAPAKEEDARQSASLFTDYLRAARDDRFALSTLPPGRFLLPGHLKDSPLLTFSPLPVVEGAEIIEGSLAAMMERRYESYKTHVVKPFFVNHFSRLDRQIVLVDMLSALNSGPTAVRDLETALTDVLTAFRAGSSSFVSRIFRPRIDKILFAATKADHLHHSSHDRLEAILRVLVARAIARAESLGGSIDVIALAAARATREASVKQGRETIDAIVGTPLAGERVNGEIFDGNSDVAIFPGQLPEDPRLVFRGDGLATKDEDADYRFVKFRPPVARFDSLGAPEPLPHIRMDRALEFLIGDRLR
jgi:predicted YcjX-like family ATPase